MSKRFIDGSILPKAFRKLEPSLKLTWYYLWLNCDEAGVYEIDADLFEFENGFVFPFQKIKKHFKGIVETTNEKILLKDFIFINQCDFSKLKPDYNPHKPVYRAIAKHKLKLEPSLNQASFKLVVEVEVGDVVGVEVVKEKKVIKFSNEIESAYLECLSFFPESLHPRTKEMIFKWKDTLDKLERIDKVPLSHVVFLVQKARNDSFWKTAFMSLPKLRQISKTQNIKFIVLFHEKFKENQPTVNRQTEETVRKNLEEVGEDFINQIRGK